MLKYILIFSLLITFPTTARGKADTPPDQPGRFVTADKLYQEGVRALHDGDYQSASTQLNAAVQTFPNHADAHYHLSWLAYRTGDYFKALIHIRRAKETFATFHRMERYIYQKAKASLDAQKQSLQRQIHILQAQEDITDWSADAAINHPARAKILATQHELRRVETKLQSLVPPPPNIPANYYLFHGNIFIKLKKFTEARQEYTRALHIDPTDSEAAAQLNRLRRQLDGAAVANKINQSPGGKDGTY